MNEATVGIERCYSYNQNEVFNAVKNACGVCSFPDVKGKKVLVKPNILTDAKPEDCITTHPEVVRSVIKLLKEKGATEIYCGDSSGLHGQSFCGKNCGINDVCDQEGAIWSNFLDKPTRVKIDGTNQTLPMAHVVKDVDCVISVCKFKTHQLMYSTGAVKNLFGTIPGLEKANCHLSNPSKKMFAKLVVGICETIKPSFCIMDAVIGMEGAGPSNGTPRPVNLILASENCYALDEAEAIIMGYNPNDIPILNEAKIRKIHPSKINYPLLSAHDLQIEDFKRIAISKRTHFFSKLILPFFTRSFQRKKQLKEPAPQFNNDKCIKCKRCLNICPAKALTFTDKIEINKMKCIRCYCCHEMCPVNAIEVKEKP